MIQWLWCNEDGHNDDDTDNKGEKKENVILFKVMPIFTPKM